MTVLILVVDDEPDVEMLFRQQFRRDLRSGRFLMADGFLERMRKNALLLKQRLAELKDRHSSVIAEVRGEGLLIGLRMVPQASEMVDELRAEKMITVAAGDNVVRLLPPLIIGEKEIAEAVGCIDRACARLAKTHAFPGARDHYGRVRAARLAGAQILDLLAGDCVRPAFA